MSEPIIKVENLSKSFIISHEEKRSISFKEVFANRFKETFLKRSIKSSRNNEEFWALKDVSFEINKGERVGIIGRNGAGKSTLLKVLSRITEPTKGRIEINGRVASLLEVGTGFHPELSGRENIFLNGAILGMSRIEIRRKFDEIVAFAEIEKFLDTPVKRYSSGMYVRLAFAVAAHLEPEILIVDEVLAVGDAQFQKKCLGKMEDVSKNEGRTVLFVSHNMGVVTQLCKTAILLDKGSIIHRGVSDNIVQKYLSFNMGGDSYISAPDGKEFFISDASVVDEHRVVCNTFGTSNPIFLEFSIRSNERKSHLKLSCTIQSKTGEYLTTFVEDLDKWFTDQPAEKKFRVRYPSNLLSPNHYAFRLAIFSSSNQVYDLAEMICSFSVVDEGSDMALYEGAGYGYFFSNHEFKCLS